MRRCLYDPRGLSDVDEQSPDSAPLLSPAEDDADDDGIPDWADLASPNSSSRLSLNLKLSQNIQKAWENGQVDLSTITITFDYAGPSREQVQSLFNLTDADGLAVLSITPGVRLWRNAGSTIDDYLVPGQSYTAEELGLTPGSDFALLLDAQPGAATNDGNIPITASASINADHFNGNLSDQVHAQTFGVDLDVDVDLKDGINAKDDALESKIAGQGQIIRVNDNDDDHDLIPDWLDGFGAFDLADAFTTSVNDKFTKLSLNLYSSNDSDEIIFNYSADDPYAYLNTGITESITQIEPQGAYRLWTFNGDQIRDPHSILDDGHFIPSGTAITGEARDQLLNGDLYLEIVDVPDSMEESKITVTLRRGDGSAEHQDIISLLPITFDTTPVVPNTALDISLFGVGVNPPSVTTTAITWDETSESIKAAFSISGSLELAGHSTENIAARIPKVTIWINGQTSHEAFVDDNGHYSVQLTDIDMHEGINHVKVIAQDYLPESAGYANVFIEVEATWPEDGSSPLVSFGQVMAGENTDADDPSQYFFELFAPLDAPSNVLSEIRGQFNLGDFGTLEYYFAQSDDRWLATLQSEGPLRLNFTPIPTDLTEQELLDLLPKDYIEVLTGGLDVTGDFIAGYIVGVAQGVWGIATDVYDIVTLVGEGVGYGISIPIRYA